MYGLGGAPFGVAETYSEGWQIGATVAGVVRELLGADSADDPAVQCAVLLLWGTIHGLIALSMAGRLDGGRVAVSTLVDQAVRDALGVWQHR